MDWMACQVIALEEITDYDDTSFFPPMRAREYICLHHTRYLVYVVIPGRTVHNIFGISAEARKWTKLEHLPHRPALQPGAIGFVSG